MNNVFSFAAASLLMATALSVPATYAQDVQAQQVPAQQAKQARNVILFLADAGGVSAVHAASLLGYGEPLKLRIQQWPHLGLSETSPVDMFVSDSANGMSSIMTGVKTRNGVISQSATRSEEHTSELQSLMRISYAVFCLKKK